MYKIAMLSMLEISLLNKICLFRKGVLNDVIENLPIYDKITQKIDEHNTPVLPYISNNDVIKAESNMKMNIADLIVTNNISLSDALSYVMYNKYRSLAEQWVFVKDMSTYFTNAFFLNTALCVCIDENSNISFATTDKNILLTLTTQDRALDITEPTKENIENGELECVVVKQTPKRLNFKKKTIKADSDKLFIIPKLYFDRYINSIYTMLSSSLCRITYYKKGKRIQCVVSNNMSKHGISNNVELDKLITNNYGVIRCFDIDKQKVISINVADICSILPISQI